MNKRRGIRAWSSVLCGCWSRVILTAAKTVVGLGLAACVLSLWYTSHHLEFLTDRNDLISPHKRYLQLDKAYADAFHGLDQLVVVAESSDLEDTKTFVRRLGEELQADTVHVREVFYRIDTSSLEGKKLLLLSSADLRTLRKNVEDAEEVIQALATKPGLNTLLAAINHKIGTAMVSHLARGLLGLMEPEASTEKAPLSLAFLNILLGQMDQALGAGVMHYRSPWAEFFGNDELVDNGFLV
ncbi:MAG TPA: hypothetical protein VKK81_11060, partial [Candidatus Binatia bacterium]|nr:hypothetical protein [Candidatus Binatia bacterium]